jgi:hypothetical protein
VARCPRREVIDTLARSVQKVERYPTFLSVLKSPVESNGLLKKARNPRPTEEASEKLEPLSFNLSFIRLESSDNNSLGRNPFRDNSPVEELLNLKPRLVQKVKRFPAPISTVCPIYNIVVFQKLIQSKETKRRGPT